jgi:FkbM family methyltransferase
MGLETIIQSKFIQRLKRQVGKRTGLHLKLKRFTPSASEDMRIAMLLKLFQIDTVLDIGANTGQFAESLYDFGYQGRVISFEPGEKAHISLLERSNKYENWEVYRRCAVGDADGEIQINVSKNSVFSSALKITDDYANKKSGSSIDHQEKVPVYRLDSIYSALNIPDSSKSLLKIDTQGFEKEVLSGAEKSLDKVIGLNIEIPLHPIYENVKFTFYPAVTFLQQQGFVPYSLNVEGVDLQTGRVNTIDGLFFRE